MIIEADVETPTVDEFLEHYGVKGQKWGVRQKKSSKSKTGLKIAVGVAGVAVIAAGAVFTATMLKSMGKVPIQSIRKASGPSKESRDLINSIMSKHDEQVRLFDNDLRKRAYDTGKHYVSNHIPWVPI